MTERVYGQSTKESYKDDIEDSLKQATIHKNFEYFDDYSYGESKSIGFWLTDIKGKTYLYLLQPDGPKEIEIMKKLLEWRRSGKSDEIGHKGGGNLRNIYGFKSTKTTIISKLNDDYVLFCETNPNKLYDLSISDIDEDTFRGESDTSKYIKSPEITAIDDLPRWYDDVFKQIKHESGITPNYMIRMELTELPNEYTNKDLWNTYINQVRAKQYDIPIYFKNEYASMETYKTYKNIDLVGFHDKKKKDEKTIKLYIHKMDLSFFYKEEEDYKNVEDVSLKASINELLEWGTIHMFIADKGYINDQLKIYNTDLLQSLRVEDFSGVYLKINNKLTNYIPISGKPIGDSRNNGLNIEDNKSKSTGYFRMIIIPNNNTCKEQKYFDSLVKTETIKALSGFLYGSPYDKILKTYMDIFKGKPSTKKIVLKPNPKLKSPKPKSNGGVYIVYLGLGLYKFGRVDTYDRLKKRVKEHKKNSIEVVKDFTGETMKGSNVTIIYEKETTTAKGDEENINGILRSHNGKIDLFESRASKNEEREYFKCNDIDFIIQDIIPLIDKI